MRGRERGEKGKEEWRMRFVFNRGIKLLLADALLFVSGGVFIFWPMAIKSYFYFHF